MPDSASGPDSDNGPDSEDGPGAEGVSRSHDGPRGPTGPAVLERIELPRGPLTILRPADPDAVAFESLTLAEGVEELCPPHWARLWPSGRALAAVVDRAGPARLAGRRVLELGCGLGLPSLTAARAGAAPVVATDRSPSAVAWAAANARRCGLRVEAIAASFDGRDPLLDAARWDLVLASDVLYGVAAADALTALLPRVTSRRAAVWLTDPGRPETPRWLAGNRDRWTVRTRPLPDGVDLHVLRRRP
ncbi:methyltransferase domain-containing protein [Pseudonocardia sp. NPDC049635]|uniref:class I SAM-dependent methyltransferase n=1 Tax=Pseudonocardia sp. NPDC049635 TaxID=3155506 RepID=UPI00340FC7F1